MVRSVSNGSAARRRPGSPSPGGGGRQVRGPGPFWSPLIVQATGSTAKAVVPFSQMPIHFLSELVAQRPAETARLCRIGRPRRRRNAAGILDHDGHRPGPGPQPEAGHRAGMPHRIGDPFLPVPPRRTRFASQFLAVDLASQAVHQPVGVLPASGEQGLDHHEAEQRPGGQREAGDGFPRWGGGFGELRDPDAKRVVVGPSFLTNLTTRRPGCLRRAEEMRSDQSTEEPRNGMVGFSSGRGRRGRRARRAAVGAYADVLVEVGAGLARQRPVGR